MSPIAKVRHMELDGLGWSLLKNGKYEFTIYYHESCISHNNNFFRKTNMHNR